MSRTATIGGINSGQAGVRQNKVTRAGGDRLSETTRGVVAIVGPCEGEIEPYTPYLFRSTRSLKKLLGEGKLYDAARLALEPSNDDRREVKGASAVVVVRAQYYHPLTIPGSVTRLANQPGNRRVISAATAFRNEPFPGGCGGP